METIQFPIVKGGKAVVAKSHRKFLAIHKCRYCKGEFYPTEPGKVFLCSECNALGVDERRRQIEIRSFLKRKGRIVIRKDESAIKQINNHLDEMKAISNTPLANIDRSNPSGFIRYYTQRPFHFTNLYDMEATAINIRLTSKTIFREEI